LKEGFLAAIGAGAVIRTVTFVPRTYASAEPGDLTYVERISRNRSIHVLLQETTPNRPASRRRFLLKSYREIVSRYLSLGRIEHPLPLTRQLIRHFDSLSKRVDCRIDDFRGLGFYLLVQDGNTFYLLAGREGRVAVRRGGRFERLETGGAGVRELPVELASAQHELFSNSLRDFLVLYRIEAEDDAPLTLVMGGAGTEIDAVIESLSEPTGVDTLPEDGTLEMALVSHAVMYCAFERAEPVRLDPLRTRPRRLGSTSARRAAVMATAIAIAGAGATTVWLTQRISRPAPTAVATQPAQQDRVDASALQESPPRLRQETDEAVSVTAQPAQGDDAGEMSEIHLALEWSQSRPRAITTTPLLDGEVVIYGSRDGRLYAVERASGESKWSYKADDGVGSSPVEAGTAVVFADYRGGVFSLGRSTGKLNWKRILPSKVVSTAVVGGGEVLVGCTDGLAYCLSLETGRVLWKLQTGDRIRGTSAWSDDIFFVPSYDGFLYAVSAGSGNVLWKHPVGASVSSSPAVQGDIVVVGSENRRIYGIDKSTGERRWTFTTVGPVKSSLRVEGGRVFAGCSENLVYCLNVANGEQIWRYATRGAVLSRPFVRDGMVFVTSYDHHVYCLDAETGQLRDRYATSGEVFSSPVADDTHVYFGNNSGRFYCVRYRGEPAS